MEEIILINYIVMAILNILIFISKNLRFNFNILTIDYFGLILQLSEVEELISFLLIKFSEINSFLLPEDE